MISFIASWFIGIAGLAIFIGGFIYCCIHDARAKRAHTSQLDALEAAANPVVGRRAA